MILDIPTAEILAAVLLLLATAQRLAELIIARRNTTRLLAEGAYEVGRGHYPVLVTLHVAWLGSLWVLLLMGMAGFVAWAAIAYLALQGLRLWTLLSLGRYWTTRIIVAPDAPLVRKGPYRFLRHPNYLVVVLEIALLPLALDWWQLAAGFTLANGLALAWRIKVEEATLATRRRPHITPR